MRFKISLFVRRLPLILLMAVLTGCVVQPFKLDSVNLNISPEVMRSGNEAVGERVLWGGMILHTQNLKDITLIEVLSYPLDRYGEPQREEVPGPRFLMLQAGFLEPAEYIPGRWISAVGRIGENRMGQVGEAEYNYPVLNLEQHYLWPDYYESQTSTRFHFGIGIRF